MSTWLGATPAMTTWNYSADRGLLTSKVYADNQGPSYTYTAAGRLETRVWARGVTNAYSCNAAGDLESFTYSDGTPTVTNAFNRQGRLAVVGVGTNKTELAYNLAGQLISESYTGGLLSGLAVQNGYDSSLRRTSLTNVAATTFIQSFGYDGIGNRQTSREGGDNSGSGLRASVYTANALNQYTQRLRPPVRHCHRRRRGGRANHVVRPRIEARPPQVGWDAVGRVRRAGTRVQGKIVVALDTPVRPDGQGRPLADKSVRAPRKPANVSWRQSWLVPG